MLDKYYFLNEERSEIMVLHMHVGTAFGHTEGTVTAHTQNFSSVGL